LRDTIVSSLRRVETLRGEAMLATYPVSVPYTAHAPRLHVVRNVRDYSCIRADTDACWDGVTPERKNVLVAWMKSTIDRGLVHAR
jgi:hypothetical protein